MATIQVFNAGLTHKAIQESIVAYGRVYTSSITWYLNSAMIASSPDTIYFYSGPTSGTSPNLVASGDIKGEILSINGLKTTTANTGFNISTSLAQDLTYKAMASAFPTPVEGKTTGTIYLLGKESSVDGISYEYDVVQRIGFYSAELGYWTFGAGMGPTAIETKLSGLTFDQSMIDALVAGVAANLQVVNNITVEPSSVAVDLTGVETALGLLTKDTTAALIQAAIENNSPAGIESGLADVATAIGTGGSAIDYTAQLNESNRQLSLIVDKLHYHLQDGTEINVAQSASGGGAGGVKLLSPDGTAIDVADLLDQVVGAIASGSKVSASKLEPLRGFFEALKGQWTQ